MNFAICYNAFIPLRESPSEKSEMISQLLFGEDVEIIDIDKATGFSFVRNSFDNYEGWCSTALLNRTDSGSIRSMKERKIIITSDMISTLTSKDDNVTIHLGAGSTIYMNENGTIDIYGISYTVPSSVIKQEILNPQEKILASALKFINVPYLWGGRSSFGTDCSGFVQNIFKQAGINLPRDASQQTGCGKTISFIEESHPGDIMFFDNSGGDITHTGIYLGNNTIIHASGRVKIDSIDHQGIFSKEANHYTHKLRIIRRVFEESDLKP